MSDVFASDSLGGMLKLLARFRGTYESEWRFLCLASRSGRTNIWLQSGTSHL